MGRLIDKARNLWQRAKQTYNATRDSQQPTEIARKRITALQAHIAPAHTNEERHRAEERQYWRKQLGISRRLNWITAIGTIAAGIGLGFIYTTVRDSETATFEANRAWISPIYITADNPLLQNNPLPIRVYYVNAGKGPALGFATYFIFKTLAESDPTDTFPTSGGVNLSCDGLKNNPDSAIVFPNDKISEYVPFTIPPATITSDVISGKDVVVLQGCIFYSTLDQPKFVNFCFVVVRNGIVASESGTASCADGFYAD